MSGHNPAATLKTPWDRANTELAAFALLLTVGRYPNLWRLPGWRLRSPRIWDRRACSISRWVPGMSSNDRTGDLMSTASTGTVRSLVVDALASYRFVKLIRDDRVFEPVRNTVAERHGP